MRNLAFFGRVLDLSVLSELNLINKRLEFALARLNFSPKKANLA